MVQINKCTLDLMPKIIVKSQSLFIIKNLTDELGYIKGNIISSVLYGHDWRLNVSLDSEIALANDREKRIFNTPG